MTWFGREVGCPELTADAWQAFMSERAVRNFNTFFAGEAFKVPPSSIFGHATLTQKFETPAYARKCSYCGRRPDTTVGNCAGCGAPI